MEGLTNDDANAGLRQRLLIEKRGLLSLLVVNWKQKTDVTSVILSVKGNYFNAVKATEGAKNAKVMRGEIVAVEHYEDDDVETGFTLVYIPDSDKAIQRTALFAVSESDQLAWIRTIQAGMFSTKLAAQSCLNSKDITIKDVVGRGSFGVVHRGVYVHEDKPHDVALKILNAGGDMVELILEVGILLQLDHPHVLKLYGVAEVVPPNQETADTDYTNVAMVVEYCHNGTLKSLIHKVDKQGSIVGPGDVEISDTLMQQLSFQLASGLMYLHGVGIIHRDLKPENIMMGHNHAIKIVDFGQSRKVSISRTMTANVRGSLLWQAPEMMARKVDKPIGSSGKKKSMISRVTKYDTSADIYSQGIIMWEIYSRELPYKEIATTWEIIAGVQSGHLRPRIPQDWPPRLKTLIRWCWYHDPEGRPTAEEVMRWCEDPNFLLQRAPYEGQNSSDGDGDGDGDGDSQGSTTSRGDVRSPNRQSSKTSVNSLAVPAALSGNPAEILQRVGLRAGQDLLDPEDIPALVVALRRSPEKGGLEIKNRTWLGLNVNSCFVGSQLIDWLRNRTKSEDSAAYKTGCKLQKLGFIRHSVYGRPFSKTCFFFWTKDQVVEQLILLEESKLNPQDAFETRL